MRQSPPCGTSQRRPIIPPTRHDGDLRQGARKINEATDAPARGRPCSPARGRDAAEDGPCPKAPGRRRRRPRPSGHATSWFAPASRPFTAMPNAIMAKADGSVRTSHASKAHGNPPFRGPSAIPTWLLAAPAGRNWQSAARISEGTLPFEVFGAKIAPDGRSARQSSWRRASEI